MFEFLKKFGSKNFLGVDIGTSCIRIVELSKKGNSQKLENYGELDISAVKKETAKKSDKNSLLLSEQDIAQTIQFILKEAEIKSKDVNFSIPDFRSFFTSFKVPAMEKEELSETIKYEVRPYIPLPLSEITLDWIITEGEPSKKTPFKVLVVAFPNEVINQYQNIARLAGLKLKALESEIFSLVRSSLFSLPPLTSEKNKLLNKEKSSINKNENLSPENKNQKKSIKGKIRAKEEKNKKESIVIGLIDIGSRSTTCSIIDQNILKISHSFTVADNQLTERLAKSLNIDYNKANELKQKYGLSSTSQYNIKQILLPLIDSLIEDIKKVFRNFYREEGKEVDMIILAGGLALLPGLREYFSAETRKQVFTSDPFLNIFYPSILKKRLKQMGPNYGIAVGLAIKGLE